MEQDMHEGVCEHGRLAVYCLLCEKDEEIRRLHSEIDRLIIRVCARNDKLLNAIRLTLEENGHLADGENCTLWRLKEAISDD